MRTTFIETLTAMAADDPSLYLLAGDVGYSVFEGFAARYPDRFLNLGIAEGNLIGVAAGLALSGKNVYVYSMVPFITMRCYEQIRVDLCYQEANVKIVGVGGGLSYGAAGATHHAIEDIAIMRVLPNMIVICPGDPVEAEFATREASRHTGPVYIRLGKNGEPKIHHDRGGLSLGRASLLRDGNDLTLIATGNLLETAVAAAASLATDGIEARLLSMHTIKPLDADAVAEAAARTGLIFTLEEHNVIGGLGSAVAEILAEAEGPRARLCRIGIRDAYCKEIGDHDYLRAKSRLSAAQICAAIRRQIAAKKGGER
ncbi:MAG: transketolase family protein [Bacteroidota bacterium]